MSKAKLFSDQELPVIQNHYRLDRDSGRIYHTTNSEAQRIGNRGGVRAEGFYFKEGDECVGYTTDSGYQLIRNNFGGIKIRLRKHILVWILHYGCQPSGVIDHIDRDKQNCAPANLREANDSLNGANKGKYKLDASSHFKGVCWDKSRGKWKSEIKVMGKKTHLGRFESEIKAAEAYNEAAIHHFGEFACLNEI